MDFHCRKCGGPNGRHLESCPELARLQSMLPSFSEQRCPDCPLSGCPHPDVCAEERERYRKKYGSPSSSEQQFSIYKGLCISPTECRAARKCLGPCEHIEALEAAEMSGPSEKEQTSNLGALLRRAIDARMNNLFDTRGLGMIGGYRLVIVPDAQGMKRSWRERLFTWPWRPWVSWKVVPTHWPETLKDSVIKNERDGIIYARAHVAEALYAATERSNAK